MQGKKNGKNLDSMATMVKSGRMRAENVTGILEVSVETVRAAVDKAGEKGVHET